ncbi:DUF892 family protein [Mucilaginibacter myungsuensis]|uniref:DUF892 family protein n=1 Tax=Mucilaginibacter myungsuensis TaxID=649104 RepID=UPI001D1685DA|nr:DUF892 family protein [Mucilaginibacter myungsuensis]MDN3597513.1 DUF892 family protein [Mucilaginibacter myungsuensis]
MRTFLIEHLNVVYCVKSHLVERLPEIAEHAHFADLRHAIIETMEDVQRQIIRMDEIFEVLGTKHATDKCIENYQMVETAFSAIHSQSEDYGMRDLSILFYLQNIESIEMASFNVLLIAAKRYKNKQIIQLLRENSDEARADMALFILLTAKYLG